MVSKKKEQPRPEQPKKKKQMLTKLTVADRTNMEQMVFLWRTRSHTEVAKMLFGDPPKALADHMQFFIANQNKTRVIFCITDRGQNIGYCHLRLTGDDAGELGWVVHPDHQGNGYGKQGVKLLVDECKRRGLKVVHLYVMVSNIKAMKIYEDFGFHTTGVDDKNVARMEYHVA